MSTVTVDPELPADWPLWAAVLAVEAVALGIYLFAVGDVDQLRYALYPFVWINVALYAVARTSSPSSDASLRTALARFASVGGDLSARDQRRVVALLVAVAYGIGLGVVTGLIGLPHVGHTHPHPSGLQFSLSAPGWGPRIAYVLGGAHLYFVPYRVVGYVALSYLLYARLADLSLASGGSVIGFASCLSCTFPLVAPLFAGASAATLSAVMGYSLDISTAAFLVAVAALWWPWGR